PAAVARRAARGVGQPQEALRGRRGGHRVRQGPRGAKALLLALDQSRQHRRIRPGRTTSGATRRTDGRRNQGWQNSLSVRLRTSRPGGPALDFGPGQGVRVAKQMMVFPFTVPLDGSGRMLDAAQGVYARSLARTLAERLTEPPRLNANLAQLTADGPLEGEVGVRGHGWVVASQPWTLEEACHIGLPEGTEFVLHGSAELTDRVRIRILLVDSPQKQLALDHVVLRPRSELFSALDEAAVEIARAVGEEPPNLAWPTRDVEAYLAYLRGRDMSAAHEMGVRMPDPRRSFEPYLEAMRRDPRFTEAIGWFEMAIRERPEDTDALQGLGVALAECGRLEDAVCNWEAALSHGVHTADLHVDLSNSLSLLRRRAESRAHRALSRRLQGKR